MSSFTGTTVTKSSSTQAEVLGLGNGPLTALVLCAAIAIFAYRKISPPPGKICGTPNGPPVTAPRYKLKDGRYLAYKEAGVPKEKAKYKIICVHGYGGSRHLMLGGISEDIVNELGIYFVGFDRAGYAQSTPNPHRTLKSDVYDVQELADGLGLGSTFYVAASSMGGYTAYGLMKYLPHRLAGVAMFAPVVNYWWSGFAGPKMDALFHQQPIGDRLALSVGHHIPWLVYWYMTQTWFPTSTTVMIEKMQAADFEKRKRAGAYDETRDENPLEPLQQGKEESQFRDLKIMFGKWEFEPFDLENPFAKRSGSVHIWHGTADFIIPPELQKEVTSRLPWVQYHEVPHGPHGLSGHPGLADEMIRDLLVGKQ